MRVNKRSSTCLYNFKFKSFISSWLLPHAGMESCQYNIHTVRIVVMVSSCISSNGKGTVPTLSHVLLLFAKADRVSHSGNTFSNITGYLILWIHFLKGSVKLVLKKINVWFRSDLYSEILLCFAFKQPCLCVISVWCIIKLSF